ncbi:MAG TPA: dihydropteroate synthase [Kiritimatiellia bacterium]|nr:dihydropteroate synthase [Kiritimatiellia bacterium]
MPAPSLAWRCRDETLDCGSVPHIMGVLNVTPDSFSDGGAHADSAAAIAHGIRMAEEGARIIDVGGESSRPGAEPVAEAEELRRVVPVVKALAARTGCLLSVDTTKAAVADAALRAGAHIVNDITALGGDVRMADVVREHGAGLVLMHMRGTPRTMQQHPAYADVVREVAAFLAERMRRAMDAGIAPEQLAVDPGIGFGKTVEHNIRLLHGLDEFCALGRPVLIGVSRKSFLGALTGRPVNERLAPSLGALAFAVSRGAHLARVHDVKESCEVARVAAILRTGQVSPNDVSGSHSIPRV